MTKFVIITIGVFYASIMAAGIAVVILGFGKEIRAWYAEKERK